MKFLAIDFGDGTTCAASYDSTTEQLNIQRILSGEDEIPTLMRISNDGRVEIGKRAVSTLNLKNDQLKLNWKRRPTDYIGEKGASKKADSILYMSAVLDGLRTNGTQVDQQVTTCIGVPSDWSDEDIDLYREMAEQAGFPNVCALRESQAAVLYAMKFLKLSNGTTISTSALQRGVFLIDVGSSTTDFTYLKGMNGVHCGYDLGAKYIDRIIWKSTLRNQGQSRYDYEQMEDGTLRSFQEQLNLRNSHCIACRFMKEGYFSHADHDGVHAAKHFIQRGNGKLFVFEWSDGDGCITPQLCHELFNDAAHPDYTFSIPHSGNLGNASWRQHFRSILRAAANKCHVDTKSVTIVATGGATRMNFIEDDIRTVFGKNTAIAFGEDRQRSFSVVNGLAWAAYANYTIDEAKRTLHTRIQQSCKESVEKYIKEEIFGPLAKEVANEVLQQLCSELDKHYPVVNTWNKLTKRLSDIACEKLNKAISKIDNGCYDIRNILELEPVSKLTKGLYHKFSRPELKFNKNLSAVFSWIWASGSFGFSPTLFFSGQIINLPSNPDQTFSEGGFLESHFAVAKRNFKKNFNQTSIMWQLEYKGAELNGVKQPSQVEIFRDSVLKKLEEYIMLELDALAGKFAVNHM